MRINLAQTKSMKRYLVYTTDDSRTRPFDPTRFLASAIPQNRRFRPPVEKVRLTYHKYPGEDWPRDEFIATEVHMASGQQITIRLAERGTKLSNGLWVREFRKLSESWHQTAFLSTDYRAPGAVLAPAMFGRWSQEHFFRYMRQSFNLDGLVDYRSD